MRARAWSIASILVIVFLFAANMGSAHPQKQAAVQKKDQQKTDEAAEGAKRFATNCGRCHQEPQDVSPREAKAVLRHMRVKAMLSAEDERLILKYLAP
jgi:mono/diheme cytochrome c family protein